MKLSSVTKKTFQTDSGPVTLVYATPWADPEFQKEHREFLTGRFGSTVKGRQVSLENNADAMRVEFSKRRLKAVEGAEMDGDDLMKQPNWKEILPAHIHIGGCVSVFEYSEAVEVEADILKK